MQALRMLLRTWRGGQLSLIVWSLVLAVSVVTSVSLLAERIERALTAESSAFLAADLVVRSNKLTQQEWVTKAQQQGIETSQMVSFASMVYHESDMHLASVKAVQSNYPLRGVIKRSTTPFTLDEALIELVDYGPAPGETWVDARLLPLLNIELGDNIELGETVLKVTQIIVEEPDGGSYSFFGARVLMNWDDVAAAGVVQPGSRVTYKYLMAAGTDADAFASYANWLESQLSVHDRLITPDEAQASIASTMDRGRRFLLLAGSIGVVLAGIALALASHHFAAGQTQQVALLKSWGVSARRVRSLYLQQSLWLGLGGSLAGLAAGYIFSELLISTVREWLPIALPSAGIRPWITGMATGLLCLGGFTVPALWHLPAQSPLAVLRQDIQVKPVNAAVRGTFGIVAVAGLLLWYSNSLMLSLAILAGFAITALATVIIGLMMLRLAKNYGQRLGSIWRLALNNLWRRKSQSLIQMVGFSGAIALLMIMVVVRTSLVDEWRVQLAEDAPNHFLVNVASYELEAVKTLVEDRGLETAGWYAMVRGRMAAINGELITEAQKDSHESFRRELNLSWTSALPEGNKVTAGKWWDDIDQATEIAPVSLEDELAAELGLKLGDRITFSVGGLTFESEVVSTRSLNWDNMTPNFYFLFPEGLLEDYPRTSMTSLYIPPQKKLLVNELLRKFPTVLVIELDKIIDRIRTIVSQVTRGLEVMTLLILSCGVLVMFAAVSLSMSERLQESAILRTLGSSQRLILGIQWVEFTTLGLMAGLLASIGAEAAVAILQRFMFDMPFALHPWLWLAGPLAGGVLVGALGVGYSRKAVVQPPLEVLRDL
ncbi:MAG: putative ABC transport system permease protein [Parasphingorhabdus sp.]|jgi:putative ABC transport system permease protein|tara:strand:- start:21059 stop:23548 length:2490 start_codon:yes stop_codon:yes gene_type:complete